jgi:O-antigen ligase
VYSHVLPTLAYGDHIRYSLAVALFIIWSVYYLPRLEHKGAKWWVIIAAIFLSVYLHILAARTGLVIWYLFVALWSLRLLFTQSPLKGIAVIAFLVIGSTLAVRYIPTLEKRVWYIKHTYELYQKGDMASGYSDMGRLISYDIATDKIKQNLFTGVGAGDMLAEMNSGYDAKYPDVPPEYRLLPHNQFLIVCLGCGIVAFALFMAWVCYPLRWVKRTRDGFFLFTVWLSLLLALLVEPMLEVQLGVFVYLFFLLWQRHAMQLNSKHS